MQNVEWPSAAKIGVYRLNVRAHSRGGVGRGGDYSFERGPGARFEGEFEVVPMAAAAALTFRAFLHSLRGRSGTFLVQIPSPIPNWTLDLGDYTNFSDDTDFDDDTGFDDLWDGVVVDVVNGELATAANADAESITVSESIIADTTTRVGTYMVIGDVEMNGQLFRITDITDHLVTVRPRLRAAYPAGTAVTAGRATGKFRLNEPTPAIPLIGPHSLSLKFKIAEPY